MLGRLSGRQAVSIIPLVPGPGTGHGEPGGEVTVVPSCGHLALCKRERGFVPLLFPLLQELVLSQFSLCNKGDRSFLLKPGSN